MTLESFVSLAGMAIGLVGILHVLIAYRGTIKSAEPDPEKVRRFVETAPYHLLNREKQTRPEQTGPAEGDQVSSRGSSRSTTDAQRG